MTTSLRLLPYFVLIASLLGMPILGCGTRAADDAATESPSEVPPAENSAATETAEPTPPVFELDADKLLAMRLPEERVRAGWIRLFDGHTLFGWQMAGAANWRTADKQVIVDAGEKSLLGTSLDWLDYELQLEFKADEKTNSGIFLRTPLVIEDPAVDCYELNIAPPDNPFPTGSLVGRRKVEPADLGEFDHSQWHTFEVRVEGDEVTVRLDGRELYSWTDPSPLPAGQIAIQHNQGRIAFRNIQLRPLGFEPLLKSAAETESADALGHWKQYPEMEGKFEIDEAGNLHVRGGLGQLETREQYADFSLRVEAKTAGPQQNSGIFFRCIPGDTLMGYECQINNDMLDGNPLRPADCGTGGIFRRQDARIIAAGNDEWFTLMLVASGPQTAAWVNGLQVSDWRDTREPDPNPRRGLRLEAGTIMLQAHDPGTDVRFRSIEIAPRETAAPAE